MVNSNDHDIEQQEDSSYNNTRRQFVAGSAGALGGIAAGSAFVGPAFGQEEEEEEEEDEEEEEVEEEEMPEDEFEDDVEILNYARTLKLLTASFYQQGLENIDEEAFCDCRSLTEGSHLQEQMVGELQTIQEHESAHAEALGAAVEDLGGEPAEEPEVDFGIRVEYPMAFLGTAAELEDVSVAAFAGAAPQIENEAVLPAALGIHSVDARHASFVRTAGAQTGFPDVVDAPLSRDEVMDAIAPYLAEEPEEPDEPEPEDEEEPEPEDEEEPEPEDEEEPEPEDEEEPEPEDEEEPEPEDEPDNNDNVTNDDNNDNVTNDDNND